MLDQITAADIDLFWAGWKLGPRAKGKRLSTLRAFFRFCANRKWISESPVSSDIKAPVGSSKAANKAPFTDDEIKRIIAACDHVKVEWKNETGLGVWTGEDLKDLIWLMLYTGFRISDATLFSMKRLHGNQVFIRAKKNGATCLRISLMAAGPIAGPRRSGRRTALHRRAVRASRDHHQYLATTNREGVRRGGTVRGACDAAPIPPHVRAHPSAARRAGGGRR